NKIRIITPQRKKFIDENERLLGDDFIRVVDDLFVDNDFYKYKLLYKDNKFFVNNECVELEVSKNICISKGFTLFITTYNRPELLKRCLNYFSSCLDDNFIISKIYVIDVSEEKFFKENDDVIKEYKNIEINHNKYELGVFFHKFIFEVYEQIEDDYIAVCADDDFLMKESITRSIYEMETDNEIITVLGNQYYFIDNDLNNFYYNEFIDSKNCIYSKNVIDRIGNKNEQYEGLYKVFNKKLYKNLLDENVEFLANKNIIYVQLRELFYYYMLPLYGKMKYVSMPFGIRNADTNSWGGEVNSYNNLHSTIEHKKLEEHYSLARIHMVKKIIKLGKNEELAEKITDKVFTYFFEQQIERYKNVEGINIEQRFLEKDYFKIIDGKFINAK
ncbi:TIGR00180 family glycosyltransferase, partial [Clostridium saccharoperbutylacetonicum]